MANFTFLDCGCCGLSQLPAVAARFLCLISCAMLLHLTCGALLFVLINLNFLAAGWADCSTKSGFKHLRTLLLNETKKIQTGIP